MVDALLMVDAASLPTRRSVASLTGTSKSEESEKTVTRIRRKVPDPGNRISSVSTSSSADKADKRTSAGSWEAAVASAVEAAGVSATESLSESVFRAVEEKVVAGVTATGPNVHGASIASTPAMPGSPIRAIPLAVMPEPSITMAKPASRTTPAIGSQSNSIAGSFKRMFGSSSAAPASVISKPVAAPVSTPVRDAQTETSAAAPAVSGKVQNLIKKFGGPNCGV